MRTILKSTVRNFVTIASILCVGVGAWMLYVTPGLSVWENGRLTDLGCYTVAPAAILAVFAFLWWIAPHWEVLFGEKE